MPCRAFFFRLSDPAFIKFFHNICLFPVGFSYRYVIIYTGRSCHRNTRPFCLRENSMDIKQINYIITIADEGNIGKAAEKLFITQSALDQQLLKLENELGVQLFRRARGSFFLTEAGSIYVEYGRKMIDLRNEAYSRIYDITAQKRGTLVVSFAPERGMNMFTSIYPSYYRDHPDIKVTPKEMGVRAQIEQIANSQVDLGFITHKDKSFSGMVCRPLLQEEFVLITPKGYPVAGSYVSLESRYPIVNPEHTRSMVFCFINRQSTQRDVIDPVFSGHGLSPEIFLETDSNRANISLVRQGVCCSVVPHQYVRNDDTVDKYLFADHPTWYVSTCYKSTHYLSQAARDFITLAEEYFKNNA